jgi:hypothetical protein
MPLAVEAGPKEVYMHITRTIVLTAAAAGLALGTAQAQSDKPKGDVPNFNQMDKNNDGALTRQEAAANPRLAQHYDKVDRDGDGKLTRSEYLAVMAREDLHSLREGLAEFIDPEDKPPLASGHEKQQTGEAVPGAASPQLVRNVQSTLRDKGIDAGPVDGIWGPQTRQGVQQFQQREGMKATGQLNAQTLAALGIEGEQSASAGGSASAGTSARVPTFDSADRNNDGSVDQQEFQGAFRQ